MDKQKKFLEYELYYHKFAVFQDANLLLFSLEYILLKYEYLKI